MAAGSLFAIGLPRPRSMTMPRDGDSCSGTRGEQFELLHGAGLGKATEMTRAGLLLLPGLRAPSG